MARRFSARRYAQAVFDIALEKKELAQWQSDLEKVARLGQDGVIVAFLESPKVRFDDKARLLSERLGDINPLALNLVCLLFTRGGLTMLADIADEYQHLLDSHRGIERAEVTTAVPLDDADRLRLSRSLGDIIGKKVVLKPEVDSRLIGGIIIRVAGKLLDGSTSGKLAALKRELA